MRRRFTPPPEATRLLVVNADDFGISPGVNRGIVEAHRLGIVTSASLMPNLPSSEDAAARAARCPSLQLGMHLTLTAGKPLSPPERVPSLVDRHGHFPVLGHLLARLSLGRVRHADLARELDAQVTWALERGVRLDHLDSHHHVHIHPRAAGLVLDLAARHGIPYVRCPDEGLRWPATRETDPRNLARVAIISPAARGLRRRLRPPLRSAHHFRGAALGPSFRTTALLRTLRHLPPGLTELMTHPGYPDAELALRTAYVAGRDRELAALTAPASRALIEAGGIRLVTFREMAENAAYTS